MKGGAHPELVVDDHEDHRELPERGEVHGLAEGALVRGAVAHHREDHVVGALVVRGEGDAGRERKRAAHDSVAAEEALVPVEQVHGAPAAAGAAVDAAEQLGHDGVRMRAARERLAMLAVGGHEVVRVAERLGGADDGGLLADAEVEEAADLRLRVHLAGALLEAADEEHLLEDGPTGLLVRQVVLDLAEADLLETDYVARALPPVAALAGSSLLGTVTGLRGVTGSHWLGGYPSSARFSSASTRMGGTESAPHAARDTRGGLGSDPRGEPGSHTRRDPDGELDAPSLGRPPQPHSIGSYAARRAEAASSRWSSP